MSKKLNILKYAKFQALICAMVGLLFGIFYSFGGLIVDTLVTLELSDPIIWDNTPGLSYGTLLAFMALFIMTLFTAGIGFISALVGGYLFNKLNYPFKNIDMDFEQKIKSMTKKILILLLVAFATITNAQNTLDAIVISDTKKDVLIGDTLLLKGTTNGASTNIQGAALLNNIPNGKQTIIVSYIGYESIEVIFDFPQDGLVAQEIKLSNENTEIDEIIVEATRGNRTVANIPTRTEVLTDEIDEAASMEASKIAHLITHSTGIQVQTTAAGSNGAVVRIQGLNGRYTQMLKDGFPLYGGFSGSLDILQIPPLDLRQVEFVKGSASTLYGGGAIAGIVNLLTKKAEKDETLLHINISHIGARDFNVFNAKRFGKMGLYQLGFYAHSRTL